MNLCHALVSGPALDLHGDPTEFLREWNKEKINQNKKSETLVVGTSEG